MRRGEHFRTGQFEQFQWALALVPSHWHRLGTPIKLIRPGHPEVSSSGPFAVYQSKSVLTEWGGGEVVVVVDDFGGTWPR